MIKGLTLRKMDILVIGNRGEGEVDTGSMYLKLMYQPSIVPQHLGQGVSSGPLP